MMTGYFSPFITLTLAEHLYHQTQKKDRGGFDQSHGSSRFRTHTVAATVTTPTVTVCLWASPSLYLQRHRFVIVAERVLKNHSSQQFSWQRVVPHKFLQMLLGLKATHWKINTNSHTLLHTVRHYSECHTLPHRTTDGQEKDSRRTKALFVTVSSFLNGCFSPSYQTQERVHSLAGSGLNSSVKSGSVK